MTLLSLRAGRLAVDLAPQAGGSITRFSVEGAGDVLRSATAEASASGTGRDTACYPLVPFSNRIADGRLAFENQEFHLSPNWPGVRHPMHGDGWSHAWSVAHADVRAAELVYEHDGSEGWPVRYRARQHFRLHDDRLVVRMSIENLEGRRVPAGLGLHPFFTRDAETELQCCVSGVWRTDPEVLPLDRVPVPPDWDFSRSRKVDGLGLDHCFDGWDGKAVIGWPGRNMRLTLSATEAFRHLVIYIPDGRSFFCVEPVSHANGQVGRHLLDAGATLAGEIAFTLSSS